MALNSLCKMASARRCSARAVNYAHALRRRYAIPHHSSSRVSASGQQPLALLRVGWPVFALLGLLWFPFDWLSEVWPAFGVLFRMVFRNTHDHFVGHTIFFLIVGLLLLAYVPALRRPYWYFPALVVAALAQETIQALARGAMPTFTDTNAFTGDAIGGFSAFALWVIIGTVIIVARLRPSGRKARQLCDGGSSRAE
jgi:hypothetical protein